IDVVSDIKDKAEVVSEVEDLTVFAPPPEEEEPAMLEDVADEPAAIDVVSDIKDKAEVVSEVEDLTVFAPPPEEEEPVMLEDIADEPAAIDVVSDIKDKAEVVSEDESAPHIEQPDKKEEGANEIVGADDFPPADKEDALENAIGLIDDLDGESDIDQQQEKDLLGLLEMDLSQEKEISDDIGDVYDIGEEKTFEESDEDSAKQAAVSEGTDDLQGETRDLALQQNEEPFMLPSDRIEAALERVINKIFSEKIESILLEVVEKTVSNEINKLRQILIADTMDDDDE
ncbi:MAG: hypothetical protein GY800_04850, partial [Planctomycetes bacterium]|nr:hypothetical protein [Planctomycetota bacterium]